MKTKHTLAVRSYFFRELVSRHHKGPISWQWMRAAYAVATARSLSYQWPQMPSKGTVWMTV